MFFAPVLAALAPTIGVERDAVPWVLVDVPKQEHCSVLVDPQLVVLSNGACLACATHFASADTNSEVRVSRSEDSGRNWKLIATVADVGDATLFVHDGDAWLMSVDGRRAGRVRVVIRRSRDQGSTWSEPLDAAHGLLRDQSSPSSSAIPVVIHGGRIWRTFVQTIGHGNGYTECIATIASADASSDLLDARSWRWSRELDMRELEEFARVIGGVGHERTANNVGLIVHDLFTPPFPSVRSDAENTRTARIRERWPLRLNWAGWRPVVDGETGLYFALTLPAFVKPLELSPTLSPGWHSTFGSLTLYSSTDLEDWVSRGPLLSSASEQRLVFTAGDWLVQGDDLIAVLCLARTDLTMKTTPTSTQSLVFLRIPKFRERTDESPPLWGPPLDK